MYCILQFTSVSSLFFHIQKQPCLCEAAVDPPHHRGQTLPDTSVVPPCSIHVYMPNLVCPSVRPVWPNQSLDLVPDFCITSSSAQVAAKSLRTWTGRENKALMYLLVFLFFTSMMFSRRLFASQHISHYVHPSLRGCHWGYLDQVGCVMHLLSALVPWRSRRVAPPAEWCMFISCHHFQLNSQALRSTQDVL